MKVIGSYWTFTQCWPTHTAHSSPILYTLDNSERVNSIFPLAGLPYEWVITPVEDRPSESNFLSTYGYAHKVENVQL